MRGPMEAGLGPPPPRWLLLSAQTSGHSRNMAPWPLHYSYLSWSPTTPGQELRSNNQKEKNFKLQVQIQ